MKTADPGAKTGSKSGQILGPHLRSENSKCFFLFGLKSFETDHAEGDEKHLSVAGEE